MGKLRVVYCSMLIFFLILFPNSPRAFYLSSFDEMVETPLLKKRIRETIDFIDNFIYDKTYGGFFHYTDRNGENTDEYKYASLHAWSSMVFFNVFEVIKDIIPFYWTIDSLEFLINYLFDEENGGFYHCVDRNGSLTTAEPAKLPRNKYTTYQAWICLWLVNFRNYNPNFDYLNYATSAFNFLVDNLWDEEYNGFFRVSNENGTILENVKEIFGQFWAINALLEFSEATKNDTILTRYIDPALEFIIINFWDSVNGGFYERTYANGTLISDRKNLFSQASAIFSLLQLYKYNDNETLLNSLVIPTIEFVINNLWDSSYNSFYESCNKTGNDKITYKNPTHESMIIWSLMEFSTITANTSYFSYYCVPTIDFMNNYLWDQTYGGFYEKCSVEGTPFGTEKWFNDQFFVILIYSKILSGFGDNKLMNLIPVGALIGFFGAVYYYLNKKKQPKKQIFGILNRKRFSRKK